MTGQLGAERVDVGPRPEPRIDLAVVDRVEPRVGAVDRA